MLNRKNVPIAAFAITVVLMMAVTALGTQAALAQGGSAGDDHMVDKSGWEEVITPGTTNAFTAHQGGETGANIVGQDSSAAATDDCPRCPPGPIAIEGKPKKPPLFPE